MKKFLSIFLIISLSAFYAVAQKAKVQTAWNYYKEPYQQYDKAKEAIDEAILNDQSSGMAKTWYYRGLIYQSLYKSEKYPNLCDNCLWTSFESFQKAMTIDPGNEWADEIKMVRIPWLTNKVFDNGVQAFNSKDYKTALMEFEKVQLMAPGDTSVLLNSAYSAERGGDLPKAKKYYSKLVEMKYPDENVYISLSNLYKQENDTTNALKLVQQGRKLFPESINMMLAEINLLLSMGRNAEATKSLDAAIAKDPTNPSLYLALGSTYDNLANPKDSQGKDLGKPKNHDEFMTKAEETYKKGLSVAPDNYVLNYNLGALYFNNAAEMANQANKITDNAQYAKAKEAFDAKFREAEPYLEKALDKNPKKTEDDMFTYNGTLTSLKQLYVRTGESEKYDKIKALVDQNK